MNFASLTAKTRGEWRLAVARLLPCKSRGVVAGVHVVRADGGALDAPLFQQLSNRRDEVRRRGHRHRTVLATTGAAPAPAPRHRWAEHRVSAEKISAENHRKWRRTDNPSQCDPHLRQCDRRCQPPSHAHHQQSATTLTPPRPDPRSIARLAPADRHADSTVNSARSDWRKHCRRRIRQPEDRSAVAGLTRSRAAAGRQMHAVPSLCVSTHACIAA